MKGKIIMSKTGKSSYFNPSTTLVVNGQTKSGISYSPNGTTSYFNMNDAEKEAYEYAQNKFAKNLSKLNVFDEDTKKELNNTVNTFIEAGTKDINDIYEPILTELQNDIASRFGNLDNSIFMDNLNSIEEKRAEAVGELAQNAELLRQDLVNNELANRYEFMDFLNSYGQQVLNNILSTIGSNNSVSNSARSYYSTLASLNSGGADYLSPIINKLSSSLIDKAL